MAAKRCFLCLLNSPIRVFPARASVPTNPMPALLVMPSRVRHRQKRAFRRNLCLLPFFPTSTLSRIGPSSDCSRSHGDKRRVRIDETWYPPELRINGKSRSTAGSPRMLVATTEVRYRPRKRPYSIDSYPQLPFRGPSGAPSYRQQPSSIARCAGRSLLGLPSLQPDAIECKTKAVSTPRSSFSHRARSRPSCSIASTRRPRPARRHAAPLVTWLRVHLHHRCVTFPQALVPTDS